MTAPTETPVVLVALLLVMAAVASAQTAGAAAPQSLADCDSLRLRRPSDAESYRCYFVIGTRRRALREAERRLETLLGTEPDNDWARLTLAQVRSAMGRKGDGSLVRAAAEGFAARGEAAGEVRSRILLARVLRTSNEDAAALEQLELARVAAETADDRSLLPSVEIEFATFERLRGRQDAAWRRLKRLEPTVFPDGPLEVRLDVLDGLAAIAWYLGRHRSAWGSYEEQLALLPTDLAVREARIRRNMAALAPYLVRDGAMTGPEQRAFARESLEFALRAGRPQIEIGARIALAETLDGTEAVTQARRAVADARRIDHHDQCWALWVLARKLVDLDPRRFDEAHALLEEAVTEARSRGNRNLVAQSLLARSRTTRRAGPREQAVAESLEALRYVESLRDLQLDSDIRSRSFGRYAGHYDEVADWLLGSSAGPASEDPAGLAFEVLERLRARELLDTLDGAGVTVSDGSPAAAERTRILHRIVKLQRSLAAFGDERRSTLLAELEVLERREDELRAEIAGLNPRFASLHRPDFPTLADFRRSLDPDQAIVLFFRGGGEEALPHPRGLLISRSRTWVVDLPPERELQPRIEAFLGLLHRRDGSERTGAEVLGELLMGDVLAALTPKIDRLVLVPYGFLHEVPFGPLLIPGDDRPLGVRFALSRAPSATAWLRSRDRSPSAAELDAIIFADPASATPVAPTAWRQAGILGAELGPAALPYARNEARAVLRRIGGHGKILVGKQATETAFKARELADSRWVHVAAHAVVDNRSPERSAILLVPGSADEDGLLQFHEVLELDLDGSLVVLSACHSGSGEVVAGEGAMGLAHAFLRAGARTVVASLWPLRDDEVPELVESLAAGLARGESVSEALTGARNRLWRDGAPPAAWAGLVAFGNAELIPFPEGRTRPDRKRLAAAGLVVLGLLVGSALLVVLRSRKPALH